MADEKIKLNSLTANTTFLVRGKIAFSRLARQTTDEEREKNNQERKAKNRNAIDITKNYTSITLVNAQVLPKNPAAPTLEEQYAAQSCYKSSNAEKYPGWNFTAMNKSSKLPQIGVVKPDDEKTYTPISLDGKELASGLDVTAVCRVFDGKNGNKGVSLDSVLVNEPIRYYEGRTIDNSLKEFGLVFESSKPNNMPTGNIAGTDEAASVPNVQKTPVAQSDMSNAAANPNPSYNANANQASPFSSYGAAGNAGVVQDSPMGGGASPMAASNDSPMGGGSPLGTGGRVY